MKLIFDGIMDTKAKRYHLFMLLTMILCLLILLPYIILSVYLIFLSSYDSLFQLLKEPILQYTYISRILLDVISLASFHTQQVIYIFIYNVRWYEVVVLFLVLLCFLPRIKKKPTIVLLLLICIEFIGSMIFVSIGTHASSLSGAMSALHGIGYVVGIINILLCSTLIKHIVKNIRLYSQALQYVAVEIKEHTAS